MKIARYVSAVLYWAAIAGTGWHWGAGAGCAAFVVSAIWGIHAALKDVEERGR